MQKLWFCAAVTAVLCFSTAFAADSSSCPHQAPPCESCGCEKPVCCNKTDKCGNCQQVSYKEEGCIPIPVPDEKCRVLDPMCCPGSNYCLVDTCRAKYSGCCPGACYEILSCLDWSCDKCGKARNKCGCKQCGCKKQACGCKEKTCGCKEKSACGCKQKSCGCKNKCGCESKCGSCNSCGETACHCYTDYTSPGPRHENLVTMPAPMYNYIAPPEETVVPPVHETEKVMKVVGRG